MYNDININFDFLTFLNQLFFPTINYNIPFKENKNIMNLRFPDFYKNNTNQGIKDNNNQIISLYHPIFNYSDDLYNSLFNNNTDLFNLYQLPILNNNINKENDENIVQNKIGKNVTIINKKDFHEIVQKTNYLFNKLSDIRVGLNLNLYKND